MATALESASLVMIPSGYEEGTLGSLQPLDGSGDFTFSRGSNLSATRVNQDGYIEKGYENLLLQSNSFDTTWTQSAVSVTSGQSGYDGTNDAWLLESLSNGSRYIQKLVSINSVQSISLYAKAGTADFLGINIVGTGGGYSFFNLSNGTLGSSSSVVIDKAIELVNGTTDWYRCSFAINVTNQAVRIYPTNADNNFASTTGQNIYIQDAQVNQGLVAYPYLETTNTSAKGGILENTPRIDYTGGGAGSLLLEPSRTNEILYSEYFDAWNQISSPTITTNYGISPEGIQNSTRFQTSVGRLTQDVITINANETFSVYMKGSGTLRIQIGSENFYPSVTSEWIRYEFTSTQAGAITSVQIRGNGAAVDVELYGAQYERNTFPTSYIPTYGTSQTRAAEDVELPSLDSVFNSSGDYTILFEVERLSDVNESQFIYLRDSSFNYITLSATTLGRCEIVLYNAPSASSAVTPSNSFIPNSSIKIAVRISGNTCSAFSNGSELTLSNTSTTPRDFDRYQNNRNHQKHQEVYFPSALSDSACIELTTI
jgi:hypothetical protein